MFNFPYNLSSTPPPLWHNGPAPGQIYDFPSKSDRNEPRLEDIQFSLGPTTTASSIIAMCYDSGIVIGGDVLASYGSLARFRNCPRIFSIGTSTVIGASGDYGDYQYLKKYIEQISISEECMDDGIQSTPKTIYSWLTRLMYLRRSKLNPLWNSLIIGGLEKGVPFLGAVDKQGTAYTDKSICTGYGAYMTTPILRAYLDKNPNPTQDEAIEEIRKGLEVLFYRDARSFPKYQIGIVDMEDGITYIQKNEVIQDWCVALLSG